jgi:predicted GNAT family acetyltransferase
VTDPAIVDNQAGGRFELRVDGRLAELQYRLNGERFVLVHTGVPDELGGRGLAGQLVKAAVDRAAAEDLVVVPTCPYVRSWLEKHPEEAARVSVDWNQG